MAENYLLRMYHKLNAMPMGNWLFSQIIARKAPYFKSMRPRILLLEQNRCQVLLKKSRRVENHIGTMHVIATCNALEMAMGVMAEASVPPHLRWIPKGMEVEYENKGETDLIAEASITPEDWREGDVYIPVCAKDTQGKVAVSGRIKLWITRKPDKKSSD